MYGVIVFNSFFNNIGEKCRNKLLGNIFGIVDVTVSDLVLKNNCVIFRIFSNGVFYQYIFDLSNNNFDYFIKVSCNDNISDKIISIDEFSEELKLLIRIFKCRDECQIYKLLMKFL